MPSWWLLESKIRSAAINHNAVREGLRQLAALWYQMKSDEPETVGYGVVVAAGLQEEREIRIHFFLPQSNSNQQALVNHLDSFSEVPEFTKAQLANIVAFLA